MLSWLDVLAITVAAFATALGVRRGGSLMVSLPLAAAIYLVGAEYVPSPRWLPLLGLTAGLLATLFGGLIPIRIPYKLNGVLGGIAGFLWGVVLAMTLWVGLPSEYSPATGAIRYPSLKTPPLIQDAVNSSSLAPRLFAMVWQNPTARRFFLGVGETTR